MSGLEVTGAYLLGLILGGILGFMIGRRLPRHTMPSARPHRYFARWSHRFRGVAGGGGAGAEHSGMPREAEEGAAVRGATPDVTEVPLRVKPPDRVVEDLRSELPRSAPLPQTPQKPRWIARWMTRRTVEAEEFIVRDSDGTRRAKLGMSVDGWVRLRLYDEDGERCASLGVAPDGNVRLRFYDQAGTPRVAVRVLDDGPGDVSILDHDEKVVWQAP